MEYINKNYKIMKTVKIDISGTTYVAKDIKNNRTVCLKLLNSASQKNEKIDYFISMFKYLKTIKHPNLIELYEFELVKDLDGTLPNRKMYLYTFEDVDGYEEINYKELTREEVRSSFNDILKCVSYLHFRQEVYKFLNFDNVKFYRIGGQVCVKLNNLVNISQYEDITDFSDHRINIFLPAETVLSFNFDKGSDIYSLGHMLYFMHFKYDYEKKQSTDIFEKEEENLFTKLIKKMTSNFYEERYIYISKLIEDYKKVIRSDIEFDDKEYFENIDYEIKFVGRNKEVDYILNEINMRISEKSGRNGVLIQGPRGVGKTRLMNEITNIVELKGVITIKYDMNKAYYEDFGLFKKVIKELKDKNLITYDILQKYGDELVKVVPEISEIAEVKKGDILDGEKEMLKIANRIFNFIIEITQRNSIVLVLESIDHANVYDLYVLDYIFRNNKENKLFVLSTLQSYSDTEKGVSSIWSEIPNTKVFTLKNLSLEKTNESAEIYFGRENFNKNLRGELIGRTQGNPQKMVEFFKQLVLNKQMDIGENRVWNYIRINEDPLVETSRYVEGNNMDFLSLNAKHILQCTAINLNEISNSLLIKLTSGNIDDGISELFKNNIISGVKNENGMVYEIKNKEQYKNIYFSIDIKKRKEMHQKISGILENWSVESKEVSGIALLTHIRNSGNYEKSIKIGLEKANVEFETYNYQKALEYYNLVRDICLKEGKTKVIAEVIFKIAEINFLNGRYEEAERNLEESSRRALSENLNELYIKSLNKLASININRLEYERAENYIQKAYNVSRNNGLYECELDSFLLMCKMSLVNGMLETKDAEINKYIEKTRMLSLKKHEAHLLYYLGVNHSLNNTEYALELLENSINTFKDIGEEVSAIYPLSRVGKIYMSKINNNKLARKYFNEILGIVSDANIFEKKSKYLCYLGQTHCFDGNFDKSLRYYDKAFKLADDSGDKTSMYTILLSMIQVYTAKSEFDKAYLLLRKVEQEFNENIKAGTSLELYMYVHIYYFTVIKKYENAEKWIKKYDESKNSNHKNVLTASIDIFRFIITQHKRNYLNISKGVDVLKVKELVYNCKTVLDKRHMRMMLLNEAGEMLCAKKYIHVQNLLDIDKELIKTYDVEYLRARRGVIMLSLLDDRIKNFERYIPMNKGKLLIGDVWHSHKLIGDEYKEKGDSFRAISSYLQAIEVIKNITEKLPASYREQFIINDELKLEIRSSLDEIVNKVSGHERIEANIIYSSFEFKSVQDFFNLTDIKEMYKNKKFLKTVQTVFSDKFRVKFENLNDLVSSFDNDEIHNIRQILIYLVQHSFADRGFVVLTGEDGNEFENLKVVKTEENSTQPDIFKLRKHLTVNEEGVFFSVMDSNLDKAVLDVNIKGLICVPIKGINKQDHKYGSKRKSDELSKLTNLGYLYLETSNIFNNFNGESLNHSKVLANLLYSMASNYNLKKSSTVDKLTGVYLRKFFEDSMKNEIAIARKSSSKVSVVMCDIDKFKNVNDFFGHKEGDRILREIGALFNNNLRKSDYVGRYGGEEFMLLLPSTNEEEAIFVANSIRQKIEDSKLLGDEYPLTISMGVATYPQHGLTEEELLEKADQSLYFSKNTGRNRVTLWNSNIGNEGVRFDKLAGLLTGNVSNDARNMQALVNSMSLLNCDSPREEIYENIMTNLIDITEAKECTIVEFDEVGPKESFTKKKSVKGINNEYSVDIPLIQKYHNADSAEYFINWDDISKLDESTGIPEWKSVMVVPLKHKQIKKGILFLSVPITEKEFTFEDFNFINTISSVVAASI